VSHAIDLLHGEKNGNKYGMKLQLAVKAATDKEGKRSNCSIRLRI